MRGVASVLMGCWIKAENRYYYWVNSSARTCLLSLKPSSIVVDLYWDNRQVVSGKLRYEVQYLPVVDWVLSYFHWELQDLHFSWALSFLNLISVRGCYPLFQLFVAVVWYLLFFPFEDNFSDKDYVLILEYLPRLHPTYHLEPKATRSTLSSTHYPNYSKFLGIMINLGCWHYHGHHMQQASYS